MVTVRLGLIAVLLGFLVTNAPPADAAGKLTEENMTKGDFDRLVAVAKNDEVDVGPEPVHDPGKDGRKQWKEQGATKVIDGDEWQKMSPKERRDRILELKKTTLAPGVVLVVIIPKGDVYALPPGKFEEMTETGLARRWVNSDYVELRDGPSMIQGKRGDHEQQDTKTDEPETVP